MAAIIFQKGYRVTNEDKSPCCARLIATDYQPASLRSATQIIAVITFEQI